MFPFVCRLHQYVEILHISVHITRCNEIYFQPISQKHMLTALAAPKILTLLFIFEIHLFIGFILNKEFHRTLFYLLVLCVDIAHTNNM